MRTPIFAASFLLALMPGTAALALWQEDGVGVCIATNFQNEVAAIADGAGGAIIAWREYRNGNTDIYAQRIDGSGNVLWAANGVPVCSNTFSQSAPVLAPDNFGGALILWGDFRTGATTGQDIYAQRIDGSGLTQWTEGGVLVCNAIRDQTHYRLVVDENGGAMVAWADRRVDFIPDIYAGRLSPAGIVLDGNGIVVFADVAEQNHPALCRRGAGGAFITWTDRRDGNANIYAARVTEAGVLLDPAPSIPICVMPGEQQVPVIVEHIATGGAILAWCDDRSGAIYAQRINSSGGSQWAIHGVPAGTTGAGSFQTPQILSDGAGGVFLSWWRFNPAGRAIYAQRLDVNGVPQWAPSEVLVGFHATTISAPVMTSDGEDGVVIGWTDPRAGTTGDDVYAQRISSTGNLMWTTNGNIVCDVPQNQSELNVVPDLMGGAIFAFTDNREVTHTDIYANRLAASGQTPTSVGAPGVIARLGYNYPNPFNPETSIPYSLSIESLVTLRIYDVSGALVTTLIDDHRVAGDHVARWNGRDARGNVAPSGVYFARLASNGVAQTRKIALLK